MPFTVPEFLKKMDRSTTTTTTPHLKTWQDVTHLYRVSLQLRRLSNVTRSKNFTVEFVICAWKFSILAMIRSELEMLSNRFIIEFRKM